MEKVIAKFTCNHIVDNPQFENKSLYFTPVATGSEENKSFSKYTPAGSINLTISYDTEAVNFFEEGKEYFIDFTKSV